MPEFKLLTREEARELMRPQMRIDLDMYVQFLEALQPGEWKAVRPEEGESHSMVKRRLTKAASMLQKTLRYKKPLPDGRIPVVAR